MTIYFGDGTNQATASGGKILQVVGTTTTTPAAMTLSSETWTEVSGMSVTITPSSSSNKILVMCTLSGSPSGNYMGVRFMRGSTAIFIGGAASGNRTNATGLMRVRGNVHQSTKFNHHGVDSPSTASATTYKIQVNNLYQSDAFYFNQPSVYDDQPYTTYLSSSLTAMEVAS